MSDLAAYAAFNGLAGHSAACVHHQDYDRCRSRMITDVAHVAYLLLKQKILRARQMTSCLPQGPSNLLERAFATFIIAGQGR